MESRKKDDSTYWLTFVLSLILTVLVSSCSSKELNSLFKGDYSTETIRAMWYTCYATHRKSQPEAPPPYHWSVCDCVIDESRKVYGSEEFPKHSQEEITKFFTETNLKCSLKIRGISDDENSVNIPRLRTL